MVYSNLIISPCTPFSHCWHRCTIIRPSPVVEDVVVLYVNVASASGARVSSAHENMPRRVVDNRWVVFLSSTPHQVAYANVTAFLKITNENSSQTWYRGDAGRRLLCIPTVRSMLSTCALGFSYRSSLPVRHYYGNALDPVRWHTRPIPRRYWGDQRLLWKALLCYRVSPSVFSCVLDKYVFWQWAVTSGLGYSQSDM